MRNQWFLKISNYTAILSTITSVLSRCLYQYNMFCLKNQYCKTHLVASKNCLYIREVFVNMLQELQQPAGWQGRFGSGELSACTFCSTCRHTQDLIFWLLFKINLFNYNILSLLIFLFILLHLVDLLTQIFQSLLIFFKYVFFFSYLVWPLPSCSALSKQIIPCHNYSFFMSLSSKLAPTPFSES